MSLEKSAAERETQFKDNSRETTDMALFVRTSSEDMAGWDRRRIVDALVRETYIDAETAERVSRERLN